MRKKMSEDEKFMKEALRQAKKAYAMEETPIGCVLVHEGKIIARGYNKRNKKKNTLAHAEIIVIDKASRVLGTGGWRNARCMSRWNPARCVPERSCRQESPKW